MITLQQLNDIGWKRPFSRLRQVDGHGQCVLEYSGFGYALVLVGVSIENYYGRPMVKAKKSYLFPYVSEAKAALQGWDGIGELPGQWEKMHFGDNTAAPVYNPEFEPLSEEDDFNAAYTERGR